MSEYVKNILTVYININILILEHSKDSVALAIIITSSNIFILERSLWQLSGR